MLQVTASILTRISLVVFLLCSLLPLSYGQQYNFRSYSLEEGLPQSQVQALIQDQQGNLWVGTNGGGLCRFNGKEFQVFILSHSSKIFDDFGVIVVNEKFADHGA